MSNRFLIFVTTIFLLLLLLVVISYTTPTAKIIGTEGEKIDVPRAWQLFLRGPSIQDEPSQGLRGESIHLYRNRGDEDLEIIFSKARISTRTIEEGQYFESPPPRENRNIIYDRPSAGRNGHSGLGGPPSEPEPEWSCITTISLELEGTEGREGIKQLIPHLYFYQSMRLSRGRVVNFRAENSKLMVVIQQGPNCGYRLRAVGSESNDGEGKKVWATELPTPFRHEIIVERGAFATLRFFRQEEDESGWTVKLLPGERGVLRVRQLALRAYDGTPPSWLFGPRLQAGAYGDSSLMLSDLEVHEDRLKLKVAGGGTVEGSDIEDGSRLIYLKAHLVRAGTLLSLALTVSLLPVYTYMKRQKEIERQKEIDMEKKNENRCRILFLAANPSGVGHLKLGSEFRMIRQAIERSELRDKFDIRIQPAARFEDLIEDLLAYKPHVVHFSGHGNKDEIVFLDSREKPKPANTELITKLFLKLTKETRLVFLNSCYSRPQAETIVDTIDCAVGMKSAINDDAAIAFARTFYFAIGSGSSIREAFDAGKIFVEDFKADQKDVPELLVRRGVDASEIRLVEEVSGNAQEIRGAKPVEPRDLMQVVRQNSSQDMTSPVEILGQKLIRLSQRLAETEDAALEFQLERQIERTKSRIIEYGRDPDDWLQRS